MAAAVNAGTYNIDMPPLVHIGHIRNIMMPDVTINPDPVTDLQWKATLTSLLMKADNIVIGTARGKQTVDDLRGKRFANESAGSLNGISFENWKVGGYYAAIYSKNVLDDIRVNGAQFTFTPGWFANPQGPPIPANTPVRDLDRILEAGERYGNVVRANTLAELAGKLNVDAAVLRQTVVSYNDKTDDPAFRKQDRFYTSPQVNPNLNEANGYVAILGAGYFYGTSGGLDVNERMQVLNNNPVGAQRVPISGLYAVGQDSMGVLFNYRKAYVGYGAAAMAWAITSGRMAGADAAAAAR
jgi:fumarate reductase flavoprotein subunit